MIVHAPLPITDSQFSCYDPYTPGHDSACFNDDDDAQFKAFLLSSFQTISLHADILMLQRQLRREHEQLKRNSCPVRKLPPETLGYVFELVCRELDLNFIPETTSRTLSEHVRPEVPAVITSDNMLVRLGLVSRHWRRVTLGTPQLWTSISLDSRSMASSLHPLAVIPNWLQRSGVLPFSVYLGNGLERALMNEKDSVACNACMRLLGQQFYRCQSFHIATNAYKQVLGGMFPSGITRDASRLREFRLVPGFCPTYYRQYPVVLAGTLQMGSIAAPMLEDIDAWLPAVLFDAFVLDYARLRSLRWNASGTQKSDASSLDALASVLERCSSLEECEILQPEHTPLLASREVYAVVLPRLRKLSIKFSLYADPSPLFSMLRTPNLSVLSLEQTSVISNVPGFGGALASFLSHSAQSFPDAPNHRRRAPPPFPLKQLVFTGINFSEEDVPFVADLTHVESMTFRGCFLQDAFLERLAPRPPLNQAVESTSSPIPKLTTLTFIESMFTAGVLASIMERRSRRSIVPSPSPSLATEAKVSGLAAPVPDRCCSSSLSRIRLNLLWCRPAGEIESVRRAAKEAQQSGEIFELDIVEPM